MSVGDLYRQNGTFALTVGSGWIGKVKITVNTEETRELGCMKAVILGYLRQKPDFKRLYIVADTIGISEDGLRHLLIELEAMGYLKKTYGIPFKTRKGGRKITAVEVLK